MKRRLPLFMALAYPANFFREFGKRVRRFFRHRTMFLQRNAMMQCVVDDSFDGIVITDEEGRIELFNACAALMLGRSSKKALGKPIAEVIPELRAIRIASGEERPEGAAFGAGRLAGPYELTLRQRDGDTIEVEMNISISMLRIDSYRLGRRSANRIVHVHTFRDIAAQKRAYEAQHKAMEEALSANRAKSEFLANVSHELRTPLNAVIGFSEILKNEMFGPHGVSQYKEYSGDIYRSGTHLLDVINDILDVSKIESGKFSLREQPVALPPTLDASIKIVSRREDADKLVVKKSVAPDFPMLMADERVLRQIFINLLSNAVKFTEPGGTVTAEAQIDENGAPVIRIIDTGIGIPEEAIPRLMEPFFQADGALNRQHEGTGLGLHLVYKFVEMLNGTIDIQSRLGAGTVVTIRLPAERVIKSKNVVALEAPRRRA